MMDKATIWGAIVMAWMVIGALPLVVLQYRNHFRNAVDQNKLGVEKTENLLSFYWIFGFAIMLLIHQSEGSAEAGFIWTIAYVILGIVGIIAWQKRPKKLSKNSKIFLVGSVIPTCVESDSHLGDPKCESDSTQIGINSSISRGAS